MTTTTEKPKLNARASLVNNRGTTVLSDFGRTLVDVPHKNVYKKKLYFTRSRVNVEEVKEWLRDRYIQNAGKKGFLYEVRAFGYTDPKVVAAAVAAGKRAEIKHFADYVMLEKLSEAEETELVLRFGKVTDVKVIRDGRARRPKLKKDEKLELDAMIENYYLNIARMRMAEANAQ